MCEQFLGTWRLEESNNFDNYMEALDVGFITRKAAAHLKPNVIISQNGNSYTVKTESTFKTHEFCFELGKEFDEKTADGRDTKTTLTLEGGVLVEVQKWDGKETTISRELKDGKMITTCKMGDVTCIRTYCKS
ncbi:myelin P2 protein-like [Discoglossus pictus]